MLLHDFLLWHQTDDLKSNIKRRHTNGIIKSLFGEREKPILSWCGFWYDRGYFPTLSIIRQLRGRNETHFADRHLQVIKWRHRKELDVSSVIQIAFFFLVKSAPNVIIVTRSQRFFPLPRSSWIMHIMRLSNFCPRTSAICGQNLCLTSLSNEENLAYNWKVRATFRTMAKKGKIMI